MAVLVTLLNIYFSHFKPTYTHFNTFFSRTHISKTSKIPYSNLVTKRAQFLLCSLNKIEDYQPKREKVLAIFPKFLIFISERKFFYFLFLKGKSFYVTHYMAVKKNYS